MSSSSLAPGQRVDAVLVGCPFALAHLGMKVLHSRMLVVQIYAVVYLYDQLSKWDALIVEL